MQKGKQDKVAEKKTFVSTHLKWQFAALFIPVVIVIIMLVSAPVIKAELASKSNFGNSYRAGDVALFVAMPLLNAVLK